MSETMADETFERLQVCVAKTLNIELGRVQPNTRLAADLCADSLDAVEFIMRVEEEFGFPIEDEDYDDFVRKDSPVSEIVAFIKAREA